MDSFFDNPIALIFVSYAIGATMVPIVKDTTWYQRMTAKNFVDNKWTKNIGVLLLGKIIIATPLRNFNKKLYLKGRPKKEELLQLKNEMDVAEIGHLIGFYVLILLCIIYIFIGKSWTVILVIFIFNIFLNLYLVFLQQYNKRRIKRFLKFFENE